MSNFRASKSKEAPCIVSTRTEESSTEQLLIFSFETNPPSNPQGDLDYEESSLYDQRIKIYSSPLEIIYDKLTVNALMSLFKTPEEINLANLQQQAFAKLKEYKESTSLRLQYAIENHTLTDVDFGFQSSIIIIPHSGQFSETCACSVVSLGSIVLKSKPISQETRSFKELGGLSELLKSSILDKAYDSFDMQVSNMQMLVALPSEHWRNEINKDTSPLFLLSPTTVQVGLQVCLVKNDPELPVCKIKGNLDRISINISDYRLIKVM